MSGAPVIAAIHCNRLAGGSVQDCCCRLAGDAGWAECPDEARGVLVPIEPEIETTAPAPAVAPPRPASPYTGDACHTCGSPNMVRTGTCMTCQDCGDSSGGCS